MLRNGHLRTVVLGDIAFKCTVDISERHVVDVADDDGCQHVVEVIGSDEVGALSVVVDVWVTLSFEL